MHPLQELEQFYVDIRRQVETGQLPADQGLGMVRTRTVTDAAGTTWSVDLDPQRSTAQRAAFLAAQLGSQPSPADASSFAFAAPVQSQAPIPAQGGFTLTAQAPQNYTSSAPTTVFAPERLDAPPAQKGKLKPAKKQKAMKEPKLKEPKLKGSGRLSGLSDTFSNWKLSPRVIIVLVGVFLLIAAAFLFLGGSDSPSPTPITSTTTAASVTTPSPASAPTSVPTSDVPATDPSLTVPVSVPDTAVQPPVSEVVTTTPAPTTPPVTNEAGAPGRGR